MKFAEPHVLEHLGMEEVLVDGREFLPERFVEIRENLFIAFHERLLRRDLTRAG
jgi:hypothetical protein